MTFIFGKPSTARSALSWLPDVTMDGLRIETGLAQASRQLVGDHHRPVTTTGASDADRQIRFSLGLVLRQKIIQETSKAPQRFLDLGLRFQVFDHTRIVARQVL